LFTTDQLNRLPTQLKPKLRDLTTLAPKVLRPIVKRVPFTLQRYSLLTILHSIFKEALEDGDFEFLEGKLLHIEVKDLQLHWLLSYENEQLIMLPTSLGSHESEIVSDVQFSANSEDLILIAGRKEDPDTLFFQRRLNIQGDTELGLEVKNLIDAVDLDQLPSIAHSGIKYLSEFIAYSKIKPD